MFPAFFGVSLSRSCSGHCREHDDGIVAQGDHGFKGHVAGSLDGPFVALFHKDSTDQASDRGLVGKDADDVGAALDLATCPSSEHLAQSVARISGVLVSSEG